MLSLSVLILQDCLRQGWCGVEGGFEVDAQITGHGSQLTGRILCEIDDFACPVSGVGTADTIAVDIVTIGRR
jgi:hypothetical protein